MKVRATVGVTTQPKRYHSVRVEFTYEREVNNEMEVDALREDVSAAVERGLLAEINKFFPQR